MLKKISVFSCLFILFVPIGTISHEYGHILAAKLLGYHTNLHFASMEYNSEQYEETVSIYQANKEAIETGDYFEEKEHFEASLKNLEIQQFIIGAAGPVQTITTSFIGLLLLYSRKRKRQLNGFKFLDWLGVFLSLFILRELFNFSSGFISKILHPKESFFGGDEANLALQLEIWPGSFALPLAVIALIIGLYICFNVIPKSNRLAFILSGFIGGSLGFAIWMLLIGPVLIP